ncbi:MAG: hypothetical protein KAI02_01105 [Gammaproteobacteria bacterium]|nr:hypothetical protein [Gammaproteobacteria bacterium]
MNNILKKTVYRVLLLSILLFNPVSADEVTDVMEEALVAYKKENYAQMKDDLNYVLDLIRQKKNDSLKNILPEAPDHWTAEEVISETAIAGVLGGGTTVSRVYKKEATTVTIMIIIDSPLMQSIGTMLSNPLFASAGKIKRINREKAMIKYNGQQKSGEVILVIDKQYMVTIKGLNVTEKELIDYTRLIDFETLKNI